MVSSRLVIRYIGDERFGAYRSLFELFGYLNLLDAGIAASLRPLLAQALAQQDSVKIPRLLHFGNRMYRLAMCVYLVAGILFVVLCTYAVPVSDHLETDLVLASIGFLAGVVHLWFGTSRCLCETLQKSFVVNLLLMGQSVCVTVSSMIFCRLYPDWGISILSASLIFWVFVFNLVLWWIMRPVRQKWPVVSGSELQTEFSARDWLVHGRDTFLLMFSGRAALHSNNLFLGMIAGQVEVTKLYATQRLFDVVQTQLFAVGNASWAALAELYHQNQTERFRARVVQLLRLILVMGIAVVVPVCHFNRNFVGLWIGASRFGGDLAGLILSFLTLGLGFTVYSTWCLMGTGHLKSILRLTFVTSVLDVVATVIFTKNFGLIGPVLGTSVVIYTIAIPWHLKLLADHFEIRPREIFGTSIPAIISIPIYYFGVVQIGLFLSVDSWLKLAAALVIPSALYFICAGLVLFRSDDWNLIVRRFVPGLRKN